VFHIFGHFPSLAEPNRPNAVELSVDAVALEILTMHALLIASRSNEDHTWMSVAHTG